MIKWDTIKKAAQNKHNWLVFLIVLIGIALIVWPNNRPRKEATAKQATAQASPSETELEKRLSTVLEQIEGAGRVSVMITYASGSEKDIAYDSSEEVGAASDSRQEKRAVVSGGSPVVLKENTPAVRGVLVVASGAGDSGVQLRLVQAVTTVLGVDSYQVTVLKKVQ